MNTTSATAGVQPLRSYLDKLLFGALALLLTLAIARLNAISDKVDEAANKVAAVTERVDGTRERVGQTEDRLKRLEMAVFFPQEARNGK